MKKKKSKGEDDEEAEFMSRWNGLFGKNSSAADQLAEDPFKDLQEMNRRTKVVWKKDRSGHRSRYKERRKAREQEQWEEDFEKEDGEPDSAPNEVMRWDDDTGTWVKDLIDIPKVQRGADAEDTQGEGGDRKAKSGYGRTLERWKPDRPPTQEDVPLQ